MENRNGNIKKIRQLFTNITRISELLLVLILICDQCNSMNTLFRRGIQVSQSRCKWIMFKINNDICMAITLVQMMSRKSSGSFNKGIVNSDRICWPRDDGIITKYHIIHGTQQGKFMHPFSMYCQQTGKILYRKGYLVVFQQAWTIKIVRIVYLVE